ncbi:MAG: transcriptional regulator [Bacteroidetes bacterium 24-39-8]|jgi:mRNA interferase MazF|nr:MAG: transcriptional regulator [Bacteroidetes bacterium 24-39-8]OZA68417.1 MAG: transcriptional regulator [Sphingobacteriia bacterium 39-39-8]HQR92441.1 type II toxin-antitoxin system PemK/MazF family toxin [Sediminibacterium sp.]HQS53481.1 type II toxin-antitoxin system PemK/MazF family toxin [Sediminibacterium sp.]
MAKSISTKKYDQFDVWLVELEPTIGSEVNKKRPCVIISPQAMNNSLNTVLIAPLTHTQKSYPTRIYTNFKNEDGQVMLDQIRGVDKSRLKKLLGSLDAETGQDILKILRVMFS